MDDIWAQRAEALRKALRNYLSTASETELVEVAGGDFAALSENERSAIIAILLPSASA